MEFKFTSKPYMLLLIVSVVLFIMTFLPWASVNIGLGFGSVTANGMHDWGILTFLMSLFGVALSFITSQKTRSIGSIVAGILSLLGVIIYWASYLQGAGIGFGLIIALIASAALIYVGYLDYRKMKGPAAPTQPTQPPQAPPPATPPAPPPAPPSAPPPTAPPPPPPAPPRPQ
jgi:uncharacterized membrane protein (UPF0136 family)